MAILENISNATVTANSLSNTILVWPGKNVGYQPQNTNGSDPDLEPPPKFLFNYEGEQTVLLESDVTDHYVEDNTAIQDHIAIRPETITTNGFIGELNDVVPEELEQIKIAADKLYEISAYQPELTVAALRAYNTASQAYSTAKKVKNLAVNAWSSISGKSVDKIQTKQQIAFNLLYGYWKNRTLFTVQTPWRIFEDMAIMKIRAIQSADSEEVSDFELQFKKINYARVDYAIFSSSSKILPANSTGRARGQSSSLIDKGTRTPLDSISLTTGLA